MTVKHQEFCNICGEKLEPIFKESRNSDTWIWLECDICSEYVCCKCSGEKEYGNKPPYGERVCLDCMVTDTIRNQKETPQALFFSRMDTFKEPFGFIWE